MSILHRISDFLNKNRTIALIVMVILAVILRAIYVWITFSKTGMEGWQDAKGYLNLGISIANNEWDQVGLTKRGPAIPLLVAMFKLLFGDPILPFLIYNVIITSLMIVVLYKLGNELFNSFTAWFIAIWAIFFMDAFTYSNQILKEPTLLFIFPLSLLLIIKCIKSQKPLKYMILASICFTILIHTDERFFIYLPFYALFFFVRKPFSFMKSVKYSIFWFSLIFILSLPWNIRNYKVFDQVVLLSPTTTVFTSKIWGEDILGMGSKIVGMRELEQVSDTTFSSLPEKTRRFYEKHKIVPRKFGSREAKIKAFIHFWRPFLFKPIYIQDGYRGTSWHLVRNISNILFYGIFLPFYLYGFILLWRKKNFAGLLIALIPVIHSLLHAYLVWSIIRYRAPIFFFIALIGIYTINELFLIRKNKSLAQQVLKKNT